MLNPRFKSAADVTPNGTFWISGGRDQVSKRLLDTVEYLQPNATVWKAAPFRLPKPDAGHEFKAVNDSHFIFVQSRLEQEEITLIILESGYRNYWNQLEF